ncbi:hypothetical protein Ocin01_19722 [Orchesella cincta]|uniref:Uncharacterized protein n=1 Tax=Orchesella cincta TaxID=48709 RepID=A0A1D2M1W0_ORCCI|nr:hypothetical protein Ocin01_19722 [Orchesella cincta]
MKTQIYFLLVLGLAVSSTWANCWWTGVPTVYLGCSWLRQYGMSERGTRHCHGGTEYHCCPGGPGPQPGGGRPGGESGECSWYGAEGEIPPGHIGPCNTEFNRFALESSSQDTALWNQTSRQK